MIPRMRTTIAAGVIFAALVLAAGVAEGAPPSCDVVNPVSYTCTFTSLTTTSITYRIVAPVPGAFWEIYERGDGGYQVLRASYYPYPLNQPNGALSDVDQGAVCNIYYNDPCTWGMNLVAVDPTPTALARVGVGILQAKN